MLNNIYLVCDPHQNCKPEPYLELRLEPATIVQRMQEDKRPHVDRLSPYSSFGIISLPYSKPWWNPNILQFNLLHQSLLFSFLVLADSFSFQAYYRLVA